MEEQMYKDCMDYVQKQLENANRDKGRRHPFRSRVSHSKRVLMWAERLCEDREDVNREVLFTAAIFHDVGYATGTPEEHQKESAKIFMDFAKAMNLDKTFADQVASCILIHSDKWRMRQPKNLTMDQILLMEADLLDEEGALAICWDGLSSGYANVASYKESLEHTKKELAPKLDCNPMVTEKARVFWDRKQKFAKEYVKELEYDLKESSLIGLE